MSGLDDEVVAAARAGDESAFATLVERYRRQLQVHCYRMLGSLDESEDLVQETFLRAWKNLHTFQGRSSFRAWLYTIATNACLDVLDGRPRRILPHQLTSESGTDIAWLQPFPGPRDDQPDDLAVERETIELAFLAAIQHLPPRQRAVLIVRDVLGWPAKETASLLDASVPSVNSALQRARATLREQLPERRLEWTPTRRPTEQEHAVLHRYMTAVERHDLAAMAALLADEVRTTMPPYPIWYQGRDAVLEVLRATWDDASPDYVGRFRMVATVANTQPAVGVYVRGRHDASYQAFAISVLRVEVGRIAEITAFHDPGLFAAFGLPRTHR